MMVGNIDFREEEDGYGTVTMDLNDEERDVLLSEGLTYIIVKYMFGFNSDAELLKFLEENKGLDNVVKGE